MKAFGGVCILYGIFRIYRGYRKTIYAESMKALTDRITAAFLLIVLLSQGMQAGSQRPFQY